MIKSKECNKEGCSYPRFGKGYCKYHQYLREDYKYNNKTERYERKKIPKMSPEKSLVKQFHSAYKKRLIEKYGKCQLTGKKTSLTLFHCVPESRSKKLSIEPDNLLLVNLDYHRTWEQGTDKERIKLPNIDKVFNIIKDLDSEYFYIKIHRMDESLKDTEEYGLFEKLLSKLNTAKHETNR